MNLMQFASNFSRNNELNQLASTIEALGQKALGLSKPSPIPARASRGRPKPPQRQDSPKKNKKIGKADESSEPMQKEDTYTLSENSPIYADEIGSSKPLLSIDSDSVLKGMLFSEILGKPKCKRTGW